MTRSSETPAQKADRLSRRTQYLQDCRDHKTLSGLPQLSDEQAHELAAIDARIDAYLEWANSLVSIGG